MRCPHCGAPFRASRGRCLACGGRISTTDALPPGFARIIRAGTPLRDRAGSPAVIVQTLSRGEAVELLRRDGSFVEVRAESGVIGFVDAVNLNLSDAGPPAGSGPPEPATEPEPASQHGGAEPRSEELPHGMIASPGERLIYEGGFLYDPFGNRALVVTTRRVLIGGGGAALPRVLELVDVTSVRLREGSSGMALGERTVVIRASTVAGEIYIAGLRDPDRAAATIESARAAAQQSAD